MPARDRIADKLRRRNAWAMAIGIAWTSSFVAGVFILYGTNLRGMAWAMPVFVLLWFAAAWVMASRSWDRSLDLRHRVMDADYLVCPICGYDLSTRAGPGGPLPQTEERPCPECGTPYAPISLRDTWQRILRSHGHE